MVPRSLAWQHTYALLVLIHCEADYVRLTAAARQCRTEITGLHGQLWEERIAELSRAADLCEQAAKMVEDAGAACDDQARRRLLAGCDHQTMMITFGSAIPAVAESSAEGLYQVLKEIDEEP
jgi:hypothetical protein